MIKQIIFVLLLLQAGSAWAVDSECLDDFNPHRYDQADESDYWDQKENVQPLMPEEGPQFNEPDCLSGYEEALQQSCQGQKRDALGELKEFNNLHEGYAHGQLRHSPNKKREFRNSRSNSPLKTTETPFDRDAAEEFILPVTPEKIPGTEGWQRPVHCSRMLTEKDRQDILEFARRPIPGGKKTIQEALEHSKLLPSPFKSGPGECYPSPLTRVFGRGVEIASPHGKLTHREFAEIKLRFIRYLNDNDYDEKDFDKEFLDRWLDLLARIKENQESGKDWEQAIVKAFGATFNNGWGSFRQATVPLEPRSIPVTTRPDGVFFGEEGKWLAGTIEVKNHSKPRNKLWDRRQYGAQRHMSPHHKVAFSAPAEVDSEGRIIGFIPSRNLANGPSTLYLINLSENAKVYKWFNEDEGFGSGWVSKEDELNYYAAQSCCDASMQEPWVQEELSPVKQSSLPISSKALEMQALARILCFDDFK